MKATVAFYKGKGDFTDKLIRWYTSSKYSHVELIIEGLWYSTSPRDKSLRAKHIIPKPGNWDYVEVDIDYDKVMKLFKDNEGAKYDWLGIFLSQIIPLGIEDRKRWFCSEFVAEAMGKSHSNMYSPQDCYEHSKACM